MQLLLVLLVARLELPRGRKNYGLRLPFWLVIHGMCSPRSRMNTHLHWRSKLRDMRSCGVRKKNDARRLTREEALPEKMKKWVRSCKVETTRLLRREKWVVEKYVFRLLFRLLRDVIVINEDLVLDETECLVLELD
ncbi:unnamed protein product [Amoebophrya sp. A25]|nr:unnamed protein product [Amoebophrya sp. A25]|eukprot:GSA25T00019298001.1